MRHWSLLALILPLVSCSTPHSTGDRTPAQAAGDLLSQLTSPAAHPAPVLKYITYKGDTPQVEVISPERWAQKFSAGGRYDYLTKMYSANTKAKSNRGLKHAACFDGVAGEVATAFFSTTEIPRLKESVRTQASSDGLMLGLAYSDKAPHFFRLPNCDAGKASVEPENSKEVGATDAAPIRYALAPTTAPHIDNHHIGFAMIDQLVNPNGIKLPVFQLKSDYDNALPSDADRPWRGMDIRNAKGAWKLAVLAQAYLYDGMANQNPSNADFNFQAEKSKSRYWCHMPWLNVGPSGREAVHGLTKERDLAKSPIMSVFKSATPGTDWGVAYYNTFGCQSIGAVFGTEQAPKPDALFGSLNIPEGSFAAKILFTTADFPSIHNAYTWNANVSQPGETSRHVQSMRHIQMDIAIKDSSIAGVKASSRDWLMMTYYYDDSYDYLAEYKAATGEDSPLKDVKGLPAGLLHMRPMGVQSGFEEPSTGDSLIFAGAETNGTGGRLNGPADNPKSSCFSCHGTAGTSMPMVPGVLKNAQFAAIQSQSLDFSQQMSLAKRNIETFIDNGSKDK